MIISFTKRSQAKLAERTHKNVYNFLYDIIKI